MLIICSACNLDENDTEDPIFCTTEAVPGLEIKVKSKTTDAFLIEGITVIARDGDYIETLLNIENTNTFIGAYERTGTYFITVSGSGYETFTTENPIVVEKDICHVITKIHEIILEAK